MNDPAVLLHRAWFIDSSAFFAIANDLDPAHLASTAILKRSERERRPWVTSNFVVAECHALLLNRLSRDAAIDFLDRVRTSRMRVVRATPDDEARGLSIIYSYADKSFSLVDAISFAVMERLGLRTAFTFDRNFAQYGFDLAAP